MQPAKFPNGGWPEANAYTPATDQTFSRGTPVTWDASAQTLDEHAGSTTVTNILGIAMSGVTTTAVDDPSGKVDVAFALHPTIFMAKLVGSTGTIQTVATSNIGVLYGILKVSTLRNAWWGVDEDDTTNVVCEVIDIDVDRNLVYFRFIDSAVQTALAFS